MADIVTEMYVLVQRGNTLGIYGNIPVVKYYLNTNTSDSLSATKDYAYERKIMFNWIK